MKKMFYLTLIASIVLTACQKELSFETSGVNGGTTGGTGGTTSTDCKSCSYMPVCNGSAFTYADTMFTASSLVTDSFRVIKDTSIDGKTFVKIYSPLSSTYTYYNCTDGATRLIAYNANTLAGNTITVADITFIKANLPVGGTWQDKLTNPSGQQVIYNSKIVAKGMSRTLNGQTFNDVIHVFVEGGIDVPLLGFTVFTNTDYYFAKNIGLIETVISDPQSGTVIQHRAIKSYFIP
ncbi:MAG: hypothetical protein ABIQ88_10705 [Chitinophagaceae bacterium]